MPPSDLMRRFNWRRFSPILLATLWTTAWTVKGTGSALAKHEMVDLRPALTIGTRSVTHYAFTKYHHRFVLIFTSEHRCRPSREATEAWLERFLTKQMVITKAVSLGYLERPAVKRTVMRMERHMLMEPDGPLFEKVAAPPARTEKELRRIFAASARTIDGLFVRFRDERSLEEALGRDFKTLPLAEQMRQVRQAGKREGAQVFDGHLGWPYAPFSEIAPVLAAAKVGRWERHREPDIGVYLYFVRSVSMRPLGSFEHSWVAFGRMVKEVDARVAMKRYRMEQLNRASVSEEASAGERLLRICQALPLGAPSLPAIADPDPATATFFSYRNGAVRIRVSVDAFRRWFNDKFVRRIPRSAGELRAEVEGYVIEQRSLKLAFGDGLDAEPKFAEDRREFAALQALDLYERTVLVPKISMSTADIRRYYAKHLPEFTRTTEVRGHLLTFGTLKAATDWMHRHLGRGEAGLSRPEPAVSDRVLDISWEHPFPGLKNLQPEIMESMDGTHFGPFPHERSYLVFVKERTLEKGPLPFAIAEGTIRRKLLRQALDARERKLAVEISNHYKIVDHIDYAHFGLHKTEVKQPWRH